MLPGGHPHADRPNWQPAQTILEYVANCREGLEVYTDKRAAELLGWSRAKLWRVRSASRLPEPLFEALIAQRQMPSWRELAGIADTLFDGKPAHETETCPCCGHVLRKRRRFTEASARIVDDYLSGGAA